MVQRITLRAGDLTAHLLTWGAVLQGLWLQGVPYSLTLGSDRLADYQAAMRYHGALIGPVANRLGGAAARVGGILHRFDANQDDRITLHSGKAGTHLKVWDVLEAKPESATLGLQLADGEGGFPGNRRVTARFELTPPATLHLTVQVETDALTLINFANHSYWNLDGTPTWVGHSLRVDAARYLPTHADFLPTGEILATKESPLDFSTLRQITPNQPPLDHCFCLADAPQPLRDVLWLRGRSGVQMTLATTAPGVQVYDGRDARRPGTGPHEGLAIEAQGWPDAPNHPGFPPIELAPGQFWRQDTEWHFNRA
ncbi:aldose epimerase family protein [Rhodobacter ferrooxidans]|uniref:Aldose 1-epimerase n=1 Tax=Rhodobacter ferrooxidans TaxID=371731 RepID=C8S169_9RHOB|nr:aldose epimerase family protein [Rhodobacter sp. SW2]EEW25267.1 Aldose 1-epimerase [Rhodobacter sp. SW2]